MKVNFKKFSFKVEKINNEGVVALSDSPWVLFFTGLLLILMLNFGPRLIKAAVSSVSFTATVGTTLSFTMDATSKAFGTVSVGTPKSATSSLYIVDNNAAGTNTTINRASTTYTLFSVDQTIADTPNGNNWTAPAATSTAGPSAAWTIGTTKGLGFRVVTSATDIGSGASTTCGASTSWWGTDDGGANSKWSGISTSTAAQQIANCGYYKSYVGQTIIYQLDVTSAQAGGSYQSSPITFTVTEN